MAEQPIAEITAQRYLLKYLRKNLHPKHQGSTRWGRELSEKIAKCLTLRVGLTHLDLDGELKGPMMLLSVTSDGQPHLSPSVHDEIMRLVWDYYRKDFLLTVHRLHRGPVPISIRDAVDMFRREYGITEDDYPLVNSMRAYERFQRKRNTIGKRGRPSRKDHLRRVG